MTWEKIFRRVVILFVVTLLFATTAHAQIQTYEGVGEYFMSDNETIDFAKNKAELDAERNVLEKICVYVRSDTEVVNSELSDDEIIIISTGILRVIDTKFSFEPKPDWTVVKSFVTAEIDTDELKALLEREVKKLKK